MTVTASAPQNVVIEEPAQRARVRHASDLLRLVLALAVTIGGFLLATTLNNISEAITVEVIESVDAVPNSWVVVFIVVVWPATMTTPPGPRPMATAWSRSGLPK